MFDYLIYVIFRIWMQIISLLPWSWLYTISDLTSIILYRIIGYRKKIVRDNLIKTFRQKSVKKIYEIEKNYYKHLSQIIFEGFKGFSMLESTLIDRYQYLNPEIFNELYKQEQSAIVLGSHYNNWEWGTLAAPLQFKHQIIVIYKPISNKWINKFLLKNRSKTGAIMVAMKDLGKAYRKYKNKPCIYVMLADQNPSSEKNVYWLKFLSRDTACINGPEAFAKLTGLPVFYYDCQKAKTGNYEITVMLLTNQPHQTNRGEITQNYMARLENTINKQPEYWLWSHKRWKRSRSLTN